MKFSVWGQTDVGLKRESNQDSLLVDKKLALFIVADGMGGHRGGEVASALAVETVRDVVAEQIARPGPSVPRNIIAHAFRESSARIFYRGTQENPELMGMGTTLVAALYYRGNMYIGNVGDSRAYLFSKNNLWIMTEDHSFVNEQLRAGLLKEEDMDNMLGKNVITRSVGFERDVVVDIIERDIQPGETILLCSDGLSGMLPDKRIAEICRTSEPNQIVPRCIEEAKKAGGDDNISVVTITAQK